MGNRRFKNIQNYIDETNLTGNLNGGAIDIEDIENFSVQQIFTAAGADFDIFTQVSNNGIDWVNIASIILIISTGISFTNFEQRSDKFLRISIVANSGALSTYKAHIHLKSSG